MAYDVYFDKVLLPVAPSKIKTEIRNRNKTIELINEGEVNLLKDAGLTKLSFSLLLPNMKYPFARYLNDFEPASYYLDVLEGYKASKKPFQLIISRTLPTGNALYYTNLKVSLEDYSIEDSVNEGFDNKVTVNLLQYKEYGTKTVNIASFVRNVPSAQRAAGEGANTSGTSYTIKSGDTLWNIAKQKLGNGSRWTEIYNANKSVIENAAKARGKASSNNGNWIFPGTVIAITGGSSLGGNGSSGSNKVPDKSYLTIAAPKGSKYMPPYTIMDYGMLNTIKGNFKSYGDAYAYYMSNNGQGRRWNILDREKKVVSV